MVLARVFLFFQARDNRLICTHHDEQVFAVKTVGGIFIYNLNMGQPLPICAYFILALHNKHSIRFQYPMRLAAGFKVQIQYGTVPFGSIPVCWFAIAVMITERRVASRSGHVIG